MDGFISLMVNYSPTTLNHARHTGVGTMRYAAHGEAFTFFACFSRVYVCFFFSYTEVARSAWDGHFWGRYGEGHALIRKQWLALEQKQSLFAPFLPHLSDTWNGFTHSYSLMNHLNPNLSRRDK